MTNTVIVNGHTYTDDNDPTTGMGNGGFRTRLIPMLSDTVVEVGNALASKNAAATSATAAAASALSAVNAPGSSGTSTTSLTTGTGNKSFTTQTGKNWVVGQAVVIARTSAPNTTWMSGQITAYTTGTGAMTVAVDNFKGSATATDWTIALAGLPQTSLKEVAQAASIVSNVLTIDCAAGNAFKATLNANITSFTLTNVPVTGFLYGLLLEFVADGTPRSITWTINGVTAKFANNNVLPVLTGTLNRKDAFVVYTTDAGATWTMQIVGQNY